MKPPPELPTLFLDRNLGKNIDRSPVAHGTRGAKTSAYLPPTVVDGGGIGRGEEGKAGEGGREGGEVGGPAAKAGEEGVGGDRLDHGPRLGLVEGVSRGACGGLGY